MSKPGLLTPKERKRMNAVTRARHGLDRNKKGYKPLYVMPSIPGPSMFQRIFMGA